MEAEADTYIKYLPHHLYRWYKFKNDEYESNDSEIGWLHIKLKYLWEQSIGYLKRNGL